MRNAAKAEIKATIWNKCVEASVINWKGGEVNAPIIRVGNL